MFRVFRKFLGLRAWLHIHGLGFRDLRYKSSWVEGVGFSVQAKLRDYRRVGKMSNRMGRVRKTQRKTTQHQSENGWSSTIQSPETCIVLPLRV